jgi:acyl-CoA dehydrogenase
MTRKEAETGHTATPTSEAGQIAARVKAFIIEEILPHEGRTDRATHGPSDELIETLRARARVAGVLTPHIRADGTHMSHVDTALILRAAGHSILGPQAVNVAAPDEGNMYLLGKVGRPDQKGRFLEPLVTGTARSAFFMTEPAIEQGAGSDPSLLRTTAQRDGAYWLISGRKTLITGAVGARVGLIVAKAPEGPTIFLTELPALGLHIERVLGGLDNSMPGGHAVVALDNVRIPDEDILGEPGQGLSLAQVRLSPARLTHCARWFGVANRANEIATEYALRRQAFGKPLIDHEGVGFMLADNLIDLQQATLMIDWCAGVLDAGNLGTFESSMTKAAVSEALFRVVDRCVQIMGGQGVTDETMVEQAFREIRSFRIYDGPTEVHKWSIAKTIKRQKSVREP